MTVSLKHAKTSGISDGGDASLVQPSDWNNEHVLTASANSVLARAAGTSGAVGEVALSASQLLGRGSSGGDVAPIAVGRNLAMSGTTLDGATAAITTQTASYTGVLTDLVVQMNSASANNFTVPANASVAYPIGTFLEVWQKGAGQTTIVADTGVTIRYHADLTLKLKGQDSGCSLRKVGTNEWRLIGDMELS